MAGTQFIKDHEQTMFMSLAKQGILLDQYYALTHPSEPNYVATVGGDFWGMHDDDFYNIPTKSALVLRFH